ncbi:hypothetical protein GCM10009676_31520 [Prauserella halophila]|uniref:Gram-positive cocci surface proteins LPxTG domain-containing protein n=1 Tax=Prauserella halophila TaxID=185641 RepID=A0ABN1WB59_9PSEU
MASISALVAPNSSAISRRNTVIRIEASVAAARRRIVGTMPPDSGLGSTALTLASIATVTATLVVLVVQIRRNRRK